MENCKDVEQEKLAAGVEMLKVRLVLLNAVTVEYVIADRYVSASRPFARLSWAMTTSSSSRALPT